MSFRRRRDRQLACREAVELMSDYLDRRLPDRDRARLEEHFEDCPDCVEYLAQIRITIDALGHADPHALSDEAMDELLELYRRWRSE